MAFKVKEAMSLDFTGTVVSAVQALLHNVFTPLPLLNSLETWPYPGAAQRAGGQTGGGSTDTTGSVSRID